MRHAAAGGGDVGAAVEPARDRHHDPHHLAGAGPTGGPRRAHRGPHPERAVVEVGHRLAGSGSGLAIHPTTVRDRAGAVEVAAAALAEAERELADHDGALAAAQARAARTADEADGDADPAPADEPEAAESLHADPPPSTGTTMQQRRSRALGAIVAAFGLVLLLVGFGILPLWAALLLPLAASLWALRYLRPHEDLDLAARAEASSLLAEVAASTDQRFGVRRADQEQADHATLLRTRHDQAVEELRVAQRAWHELAGADTDVADVEAVVARFDPQHEDARLLAAETVGVRAAEVVLHQFRQRWLAFWRELGLPAPDAAHGERAVDELAARVGRPIVLVGPATAQGPELARVAPAAPVVVLHGPAGAEPIG